MAQIEILTILTASIAAAHWMGNKPGGRMVGGALLVIILVAVLANLDVVPLASENVPVPGTAAPVSIFLLLLNARLASLLRAGVPMLAMFAFAAAGVQAAIFVFNW